MNIIDSAVAQVKEMEFAQDLCELWLPDNYTEILPKYAEDKAAGVVMDAQITAEPPHDYTRRQLLHSPGSVPRIWIPLPPYDKTQRYCSSDFVMIPTDEGTVVNKIMPLDRTYTIQGNVRSKRSKKIGASMAPMYGIDVVYEEISEATLNDGANKTNRLNFQRGHIDRVPRDKLDVETSLCDVLGIRYYRHMPATEGRRATTIPLESNTPNAEELEYILKTFIGVCKLKRMLADQDPSPDAALA